MNKVKLLPALLVSLKAGYYSEDSENRKGLWAGGPINPDNSVKPEQMVHPVNAGIRVITDAKWDWSPQEDIKKDSIGSFLSWNPDSLNSKGEHGELDFILILIFKIMVVLQNLFLVSFVPVIFHRKFLCQGYLLPPKRANDKTFFYDSDKLVSIINSYLSSRYNPYYGFVWEG